MSDEHAPSRHGASHAPEHTVEEVVRHQMSAALGGVRGMLEAAIPAAVFTVAFLTLHDLRTALIISVGAAVVLLLVRLVQRSSVQFVFNAFVGIGIGALFAWMAAARGGDQNEQALAYFLPGVIYNAAYAVGMTLSILVRWPVLGFMVGSVTGEPTAWRQDPKMVKLCSKLTWMLVIPCVARVVVLGLLYLGGRTGSIEPGSAIAALGFFKLAMGWPLTVVALGGIVWLLSRNKTPLDDAVEPGVEPGPSGSAAS